MKPLKIYIDSQVDSTKLHNFFSQISVLVKDGALELVQKPKEAHVAITNYKNDLREAPQEIFHFFFYSSIAAKYDHHVISPEDLLGILKNFHQLLNRDLIVSK